MVKMAMIMTESGVKVMKAMEAMLEHWGLSEEGAHQQTPATKGALGAIIIMLDTLACGGRPEAGSLGGSKVLDEAGFASTDAEMRSSDH